MSKNPVINGLAASVYIALIGWIMNFGSKTAGPAFSTNGGGIRRHHYPFIGATF